MMNDDTNVWIETPFLEKDISCIFLGGDKLPGPDGFSAEFFQHGWDIAKEDMVLLFEKCFRNCKVCTSTNSNFIVLVPRTDAAKIVKDYRPLLS